MTVQPFGCFRSHHWISPPRAHNWSCCPLHTSSVTSSLVALGVRHNPVGTCETTVTSFAFGISHVLSSHARGSTTGRTLTFTPGAGSPSGTNAVRTFVYIRPIELSELSGIM